MSTFLNTINMVNPIDNIVTILTKFGLLGAATSLVACGGAFLVWTYWHRRGREGNKKNSHILTRSLSIGVLYGGHVALKRLSDYQDARADATLLEDAEKELKKLIADEQPDFVALQRVISKLEMSGRDQDAVEILEKELQKPEVKTQSLKEYEIGMLLAEMLIYMGQYEKARRCKCLTDEFTITDVRRPLYNAIIHNLWDSSPLGSAEKYWEDFKEIRENFEWPPSLQEIQDYQIPFNLNKFQNAVKVLRQDIQKAKEKTSPL